MEPYVITLIAIGGFALYLIIEKLNPRKNPYAKRVKKQITINIDGDTIDFFKAKSEKCGIPYQTLINLYLSDCKEQNRELELKWN